MEKIRKWAVSNNTRHDDKIKRTNILGLLDSTTRALYFSQIDK
jgi:hypothetical protein